MPVISGKAYWPKLHTPMGTNLAPDDKRYSLDVGNLDKDNVKLAKDMGMNIKTDDPNSGKANAGIKDKFVTLKTISYRMTCIRNLVMVRELTSSLLPKQPRVVSISFIYNQFRLHH